MPKVLIAGGGVHGTFLSHALSRTGALAPHDITVVDPHEEPLAVWYRQTRNTGMSHLRSPSSHNLDLDFHALRTFARDGGAADVAPGTAARKAGGADPAGGAAATSTPAFIAPYARPTLELFNRHARSVIEQHALRAMRRRGRLLDLELGDDRVRAETTDGTITADYVILAVGRTESPDRPQWATDLGLPATYHIFDEDFSPERFDRARAPVIVGGGVTAAQAACHAARRSGGRVTLLTRGPLAVEQFDSEPCYIGPRCLREFLSLQGAEDRRRAIDAARHPGTMPWDVARSLELDGRIDVVEDEVVALDPRAGGEVRLATHGGRLVDSDLVVLATGFASGPPLADLVAEQARRHALAIGPAGYPVPDRVLRWHPRLLVAGPLGELELGPAAPNIIGAHLAARRLVPFFRGLIGAGTTRGSIETDRTPWTALTHYLGA